MRNASTEWGGIRTVDWHDLAVLCLTMLLWYNKVSEEHG